MKQDKFSQLLDFLRRLDKAKIAYDLRHSREDALMVEINVPGERWEVEFLEDDEIEVERFRSNGHIYDESMLEKLFAEYSVDSPEASPEQVRQDTEAFFQYLDLPADKETLDQSRLSKASSQPQKQ
jgi:hypothetical protein